VAVSTAYSSQDWTDLFVATAGASAALTGLVFVAVSINIERILKLQGVPERALETVLLLLNVLIVSTLGLAPGQSRTALGIELLVVALLFSGGIAILAVKSLPPAHKRAWRASRLLLVIPGTVPFVIGGVSLLAESGGGLYWTLGGIVGAFVGAVTSAWVLLVEILR
jgi:hypothetical protein